GLYATIIPLLAYAAVGPSRILVLGPDSALAPVILAVVAPLSGGDPARAITLAAAMAVVSGSVLFAAGWARLGFVTELLSKPIRYGYISGTALRVFPSRVPGLPVSRAPGGGQTRKRGATARAVPAGQTNTATFAIGGGTLALILILKRWPRLPGL